LENVNQPAKPTGPIDIDSLPVGKGGFNIAEYAPGEEHLEEEYKNGEPIKSNKTDVA
jgi:hypothetical protein